MKTTVRTYQDNGPYWEPTVMSYQAASLKDMLFHVRLAMEDLEHVISVWHDDQCIGLWEDDSEPEPDGEDGWLMPRGYYVLRRPGGPLANHFNALANQCRGKG